MPLPDESYPQRLLRELNEDYYNKMIRGEEAFKSEAEEPPAGKKKKFWKIDLFWLIRLIGRLKRRK